MTFYVTVLLMHSRMALYFSFRVTILLLFGLWADTIPMPFSYITVSQPIIFHFVVFEIDFSLSIYVRFLTEFLLVDL